MCSAVCLFIFRAQYHKWLMALIFWVWTADLDDDCVYVKTHLEKVMIRIDYLQYISGSLNDAVQTSCALICFCMIRVLWYINYNRYWLTIGFLLVFLSDVHTSHWKTGLGRLKTPCRVYVPLYLFVYLIPASRRAADIYVHPSRHARRKLR